MELLDALRAWSAQGGYVAAHTNVRMVESAPRLSAEIRKIVQARQQRLDRSYAGALVASFWAAFPWLAAVDLHMFVEHNGTVRFQPTTAVPLAGAHLPDDVRTLQGAFNSAAAVGEIAYWWGEQDLYQALAEDGDACDMSLALRRTDVAPLLGAPEIDGLAVLETLEKAGRIDLAGSEPTYALAQGAGHA